MNGEVTHHIENTTTESRELSNYSSSLNIHDPYNKVIADYC